MRFLAICMSFESVLLYAKGVFHLFIVFIICDHVVFQYRHKPSTLEQSSCFLKAVIASLPFISFVNEAFFKKCDFKVLSLA